MWYIVEMKSGLSFVGIPVLGDNVTLKRALFIIRIGTRGNSLLLLAMNGPTPETLLDNVGTATIQIDRVNRFIKTDGGYWRGSATKQKSTGAG